MSSDNDNFGDKFLKAQPAGAWRPSRPWAARKETIVADLRRLEEQSPILRVLGVFDFGPEIRALVAYLIPTLVTPGPRGEFRTAGPAVVGLRYHESFLARPPLPWSVCCVLAPHDVYHPNIGPGNGMCCGLLPTAVTMAALLELCFSALVLASANTIEWQGLNAGAAAFVRAHAARFPIVKTGLKETPPAELLAPLDPGLVAAFTSHRFFRRATP
jgi:hypothetical protein